MYRFVLRICAFTLLGFMGLESQGKETTMAQNIFQRRQRVERVLVHLENVPHGSRLIPGSNGIVSLERRRFSQKAQTLDAMASFYEVPARKSYTVKGFHQSKIEAFGQPLELWGIWEDVNISSRENEFTFVRHMPYILDVRASYLRNNISNPSLQEGDHLSFTVTTRNPSSESYKGKIVLLLKNVQSGHVVEIEQDVMFEAGVQRATHKMDFVAQNAGEYHFAAGLFLHQRINHWTDCWDWSANPLFFVTTEHRTLEFGGHVWDVKAGFGNPGGNMWSNDTSDVWVDDNGRLHLTLSRKDNQRWYATEVISQETFGYGTFTFYIEAEPMHYDPHVVAAIFLYRDEENEIDIEFSRWGDQENYQFGNYVVQPADYPGNQFRFPILTSGTHTTHRIVWKPDEILFSSWHGHYDHPPDDKNIAQWQYAGNHIPEANGLRLFFNLWLFRGIAPKNDDPESFIINRFNYIPLDSWLPEDKPADPEHEEE